MKTYFREEKLVESDNLLEEGIGTCLVELAIELHEIGREEGRHRRNVVLVIGIIALQEEMKSVVFRLFKCGWRPRVEFFSKRFIVTFII